MPNLNRALKAKDWMETNIEKGQNYLSMKTPTNVLVGSSSLGGIFALKNSNVYNMAIAAGSSRDGLDIIIKTKKYPKHIIVDVNYTFNELSNTVLKRIFHDKERSTLYLLSKQENNVKFLHWLSKKGESSLKEIFLTSQEKSLKDAYEWHFKQFYNAHFNQQFDWKKEEQNIVNFIKQIQFLKRQGTQVTLIESIMEPRYYESQRMNNFTKVLTRELQNHNLEVIKLREFLSYKTRDGIHPLAEGNRKIEKFISESLL